jgi:quinol monooxygenase YgiN
MSVIMALRLQGDPKKLEEFAAANPDTMEGIRNRAVERGLIAHRFFGSADGNEILVVDEWPDPESFQRFFEDQRGEIEPMMQAVGAESEPAVSFWHKLETHDEVGWGS